MRPGVVARHRSADESGTVSLELVLLVPVLVLLTLFVLWAGRGGRAGLTADLAAEEAVTAAALCCGEDTDDPPGESEKRKEERNAVARDVLESHPSLAFLCVGGPQLDIERERQGGDFVEEKWLEFEQGAFTRGIGVLDVRFRCETDGAVAPMAGLLPTVTFEGQAVEVVTRQPKSSGVSITGPETPVDEGDAMTFMVEIPDGSGDVDVDYRIVPNPDPRTPPAAVTTTATPGDDFELPSPYDTSVPDGGRGTVEFRDGNTRATITITTLDDPHGVADIPAYEADDSGNRERVALQLLEARLVLSDEEVLLDPDGTLAWGEIYESTEQPHVWLECPPAAVPEPPESGTSSLVFEVKLRNSGGQIPAPAADPVSVVLSVAGGTATGGVDYDWPVTNPSVDFAEAVVDQTYSVIVLEDYEGEDTETLELAAPAALNSWPAYVEGPNTGGLCPAKIQDDEAMVEVKADGPVEEGGDLTFTVTLSRRTNESELPDRDVVVEYELRELYAGRPNIPQRAKIGDRCAALGDPSGPDAIRWLGDNPGTFTSEGSLTFPNPRGATLSERMQTITVPTCDDRLTEPPEHLWLAVSIAHGSEAVVPTTTDPEGYGARGTILDNGRLRLAGRGQTGARTGPSPSMSA